ncbi:MAG: hypothetical protein R3C69_00635 [Geminicoccaceae bacterium]
MQVGRADDARTGFAQERYDGGVRLGDAVLKTALPQVQGTPLTGMQSLTAMVMPASGRRLLPPRRGSA